MEGEIKNIIHKSLKKAQHCDKIGNVGKAYAYYTLVAELCPMHRMKIEKILTDVLCQWGMQLALEDRFSNIVQCYKHSLELYPNNIRMLNNFAAHLLRNNDPSEAITYLNRALTIDPMFLPAERNLQNAYSMVIDRWHFPMLNDKQRNIAFAKAIRKRISQGYNTVLDIGTGTGLLSLYAKDAGAEAVYACECSLAMVDIAQKVFVRNNAQDIKLIPKYSWDLTVPHDIPERVKLVITETFDAGLFGELVLPSIIQAHKSILKSDGGGIVIPSSAAMYAVAVECEYIRYRSSVMFDKLREICPLNFEDIAILPDDEYYDTENLDNVKINYITEPQVLLSVNFNDLSELEDFSKDGIKSVNSTKCRYDGTIDGLVTWFQLHLDEETTIDSSDGKSCWQFAVYPSVPILCKQDDTLDITGEMSEGKLKCSYSINDMLHSNKAKFTYRLPREVITFLNDLEYIKSLIKISKTHLDKEMENILDTSPFPIYGLMTLKQNKSIKLLYCVTENQMLSHLIKQVAGRLSLEDKICIVSTYEEICCKFDSVFVHNFDIKGELKDWGQESYKEFFGCLVKPSGILLPEKILLMGQLVFSEDISKVVVVNDKNLQGTSTNEYNNLHSEDSTEDIHPQGEEGRHTGYTIAEYINEFKIEHVFDLNASIFIYEPSSETRVMIEMNNEVTESIVNFGIIDTTEKPIANALVYWYRIQLTTEDILDTKRNKSFMNHAAVLLEDKLQELIRESKDIKVAVYQMKGLIKIKLLST